MDRDGELVGALTDRLHTNGTMLEVPRYMERPGLDDRILTAGQDTAAIRRMLGAVV